MYSICRLLIIYSPVYISAEIAVVCFVMLLFPVQKSTTSKQACLYLSEYCQYFEHEEVASTALPTIHGVE